MLEEEEPKSPRARRLNRQMTTLMIVALLAAVAAGLLLASSVWEWKWQTPGSEANPGVAVMDPQQECSAQATLDGIKAQLFQRAAQIGQANASSLNRVAFFSVVRVDGPTLRDVDQQSNRIDCSGTVVLELPPQVSVDSAGDTLQAPVDYSIQTAPDRPGTVVTVGNADAITKPLSTIAATPPPQMTAPQQANQSATAVTNSSVPEVTANDLTTVPGQAPIQQRPPGNTVVTNSDVPPPR